MAQITKGPIPLTVEEFDVEKEICTDIINFEGDVNVVQESDGKVTVTVGEEGTASGKIFDFTFVASGNTANKWMAFSNGSTASNTLPLVIPYAADLKAITFSNEDDNVDIDVEVYLNGVAPGDLVFTWEVRNKRTAWKTDISMISLSQGDRLSIYMRKYTQGTGDSTAQDPVVEVLLAITDDNEAEGGTQHGI